MPQLEGPTTKIYNCVLGGLGEEKKAEKKRLATVVSSGANLKKKKESISVIFVCIYIYHTGITDLIFFNLHCVFFISPSLLG